MKGQEIIDLWKRAGRTVLDAHAIPGGSLGDRIRRPYDVTFNGGCICHFCEKGLMIDYCADCSGQPKWIIEKIVCIGGTEKWTRIKDIDPDAEYDVRERVSPIERLERGIDSHERFVVRKMSGGEISGKRYFTDFKSADEAAKAWCQSEIDLANRVSIRRRYARSSVKNDEQRARERGELKHYEYYVYGDSHHWISLLGD